MPIDDLLARGEELARDAQAEEEKLLRQRADYLAEVDEQLRRLRSFIRIVAPKKPATGKQARPVKTVARQRLIQVAKACLVISGEKEAFSIDDVAKAVRIHDSTARFAIYELREREFLRQVPGRGDDRRVYFTVLDAHVLDQIIATSENGNAPTD